MKKEVWMASEWVWYCPECGESHWACDCEDTTIECCGKTYSVESMYKNENISDGYHTFEELYYHRTILFATLCNLNKNISWKSRLHADGTMYPDYFIAGITTLDGDYTYHIEEKYWNEFKVTELKTGPVWDGHKPEDIVRLKSLTKYSDLEDTESLETMYMNIM